jgi:hypothetical protein
MQGFVFYRGPSTVDESPIAGIAIGLKQSSSNVKTGAMVQLYFLRSDMSPFEAVATGADNAICGDCRHRGKIITEPRSGLRKNVGRSCYVTIYHGPRAVYQAFSRGNYPDVPPEEAKRVLAGRRVRLGAYGDPGAVPIETLETLLEDVRDMTGYTHMWRRFPKLSAFCMASCDTPEEREEAKALGFRTFRVRDKDEPVLRGEGQCPASKEMGHATTCGACLICGGHKRPLNSDITILAHGTGHRHFKALIEGTQ